MELILEYLIENKKPKQDKTIQSDFRELAIIKALHTGSVLILNVVAAIDSGYNIVKLANNKHRCIENTFLIFRNISSSFHIRLPLEFNR